MKRTLVSVAGVLLLFAQSWRQDADRLFRERRYAEAARVLDAGVRNHPDDFAAQMLLGLCRQQLGEFDKAQASFLAAAEVQPKNAKTRYALARLWFLMGRFDEANVALQQASTLGESPANIHHLKGRIEEERGRLESALEEYRKAIASDRAMARALSGEASVLYKLGRYEEARSSAESALKQESSNEEAQRVLKQVKQADRPAPQETPQPIRLVSKTGIDFRLEHFPTAEKHLISTMTGGLAVFDFDGDGFQDLFFANGAEIPSLKKTGPRFWNRLYRNLGNWRFEDVTASQGLQGEGFSMGALAGDFDGDGRIDLFVPGVRRNLLYRNTASGFVEIAKNAGIYDDPWSVAAAWVDYDRDGLLDLFVVNYLDWKIEPAKYCGDRNKDLRVYCHPREYAGLSNRLYHNRGDGTFEDVSAASGIARYIGKGMSAAVLDADNDGWPDIFVTNDSVPNFLFRNRGDGTFEEAALAFGVAFNEQGAAVSSMGVDARDYNNDGLPDLMVTALVGETFPLFRNTGKNAFRDVTYPSRLGLSAARRSGWGVAIADLNNDGWKDVFTANSHVTDNIEQIRNERYREPSTVFLNRGGQFQAAQEVGPPAAHRGLVVADLDNDGRLDAVITVLGASPELWRNETDGGNWLGVKLDGRSIGVRVRVGSQWQERTAAVGYASSNMDVLHFGLGLLTEVPEVEVFWPGGEKQLVRNVKAGQTLVVRRPAVEREGDR